MNKKHFQYIICLFLALFISGASIFGQAAADTKNISKSDAKAAKKAERKALNKAALKGKHFQITPIITWANLGSEISLTGPNGILGADISLENFLGFKKNVATPSLVLYYSFTRRSSIYAEYYNIYRSVKKDVNKEFEFGDVIIPVDAGEIKLYFNTDIWSVGYRYSLINSKIADLSFFFNIYIMKVGMGIDVDKENIIRNYSFTMPLPSFGFQFSYELAPKFYFGVTMSYFVLNLNDFGGSINNTRITFDYELLKWMHLGLGYSYFELSINTLEPNFRADIKYGYSGPSIFAKFTF